MKPFETCCFKYQEQEYEVRYHRHPRTNEVAWFAWDICNFIGLKTKDHSYDCYLDCVEEYLIHSSFVIRDLLKDASNLWLPTSGVVELMHRYCTPAEKIEFLLSIFEKNKMLNYYYCFFSFLSS